VVRTPFAPVRNVQNENQYETFSQLMQKEAKKQARPKTTEDNRDA
jgi:hypothetical protein